MKKRNSYLVVFYVLVKAIISYFVKFHPYKAAWTIIWIVGGIIQSIGKRGIAPFIISFAIMMIPYIAQWLIKKLDGLDAIWRTEHRFKKERQRELFKQYVKEYMQK